MTIKEYLEQYAEAIRIAETAEREYNVEQEKIDAIRSGIGDGQPRGTKISRPVEELAAELADKSLEWKWLEAEALAIRQEIQATIRLVPGPGSDILRERYINLKSWDDVADTVGYSRSRTFEIHNEALDFLQNLKRSD